MLDLIVAGGLAVLPDGAQPADIGIAGGRIATIGAPGGLAGLPAARTLDATGRIVVPGGIDPHVHCGFPITGTGAESAPPAQVSRAALHGGTTTLLDFVICDHGRSLQAAIEARQAAWAGACHCDYGFHLWLSGKVPEAQLAALPEAIQAGHASVKLFTTDSRPTQKGRMVPAGSQWEVLKLVAAAGGIAAIHAEDDDLVMHMYEKLIREQRVGFEHMAEVHSTLSEELSFRRVIGLAEAVPGAALYLMHVSAATGVAAVAESRARGFPIYGETLHQYLLYEQADYRRPNGQIYHTYPSLKFPADQAALWRGTRDGALQCIATDEVCCPLKVKLHGSRIDDTTGGNAGAEPRLALMYTEMVVERGYGLAEFVRLTSTNAARIMGLYPRKGCLAVGADADIAVLDPSAGRILRHQDLHEADYTPWEGRRVAIWPSATILRGKLVVEAGQFLGAPTDGQFVPRKLADEIRHRPAV
jgi:dihydropyrimidinase